MNSELRQNSRGLHRRRGGSSNMGSTVIKIQISSLGTNDEGILSGRNCCMIHHW